MVTFDAVEYADYLARIWFYIGCFGGLFIGIVIGIVVEWRLIRNIIDEESE